MNETCGSDVQVSTDVSTRTAGLVCPVTRQRLSVVSLQQARARASPAVERCRRAPQPRGLRSPARPIPCCCVRTRRRRTQSSPGSRRCSLRRCCARRELPPASTSPPPSTLRRISRWSFYNGIGYREADALRKAGSLLAVASSESLQHLERLRERAGEYRDSFPEPYDVWLHARMDLQSQWDCYSHIGPVKGQRVLQLGGSGHVLLVFLLAGAAEGLLLTPMLGEAEAAIAAATILGVADRFRCLVAVAEEIPLASEYVDAAFSGGCVHHMRTEVAFPEIARVLRPGGRFAAIEPWRAPLYSVGTRLLGKREPNAFCRPITHARVAPLFGAFGKARYELHGTFTRYAMLGLQKFGVFTPLHRAWRVGRTDDRVCSMLGLRRFGSGVALLATK